MAKHLVQIIITGAQVVGRAFTRALRQEIAASQAAAARAGGGEKGAQHSATNQKLGMTIEEAKQILNLEEIDAEKTKKNFDYLFSINEKSKGGSFYLQSKIGFNDALLRMPPTLPFGMIQSPSYMNLCILSPFHRRQTRSPFCLLSTLPTWSSPTLKKNSLESPLTWDNVLSNENRVRCIEKMKRWPNFRKPLSSVAGSQIQGKSSAVLIPLCHIEGELGILYTVRTRGLRSHSREVSFPGGKADHNDATPVDTALRETEEEIGLNRERVDVWGSMPPQLAADNKSTLVSVLGYIGHINENIFSLNPSEVDSIMVVTLKNLCNPLNCKQTQFRSKTFKKGYALPVFVGSQPKIWGLTAIGTHLALSSLLPGLYNHKVYHAKY